jgi:hypothetical protein
MWKSDEGKEGEPKNYPENMDGGVGSLALRGPFRWRGFDFL